jgi:hypothetical protein
MIPSATQFIRFSLHTAIGESCPISHNGTIGTSPGNIMIALNDPYLRVLMAVASDVPP